MINNQVKTTTDTSNTNSVVSTANQGAKVVDTQQMSLTKVQSVANTVNQQSNGQNVAQLSATNHQSETQLLQNGATASNSNQQANTVLAQSSTVSSAEMQRKNVQPVTMSSQQPTNADNMDAIKVTPKFVATNNATNSTNQSQGNLETNSQVKTISTGNAPITDQTPAPVDNQHTPVYHASTDQGWSNDVQTITKDANGTYNIYFLHSVDGARNPFGPNGQNWEHVTTTDWQHFAHEGIAINSHGTSDPNSWKSAWTGSIITNNGNIAGVPKGDQVAYFSGLSQKDGSQNIYAAWSDDDGNTFTHALNNGAPVLAYNQAGASGDAGNERDPEVIYWNGKLLMYAAEGDKLGVYRSDDGSHWMKADPNGASKVYAGAFAKGMNWQSNNAPIECPQLRNLSCDGKTSKIVLFYGSKDPNGNPAQTTGTYAIAGHLDQNGLFVPDGNVQRVDLGSDYYGSNLSDNQTLDTPLTRVTGLGWIGNWNYTSGGVYNDQDAHQYPADKDQLENHLGSYSAPRSIFLHQVGGQYQVLSTIELNPDEKNVLQQDVHNGTVVGKDASYGDVHEVFNEQISTAQMLSLKLSTKNGKPYQGRVYIKLGQGKDAITFNYDPDNSMMAVSQNAVELENDMNSNAASNYQKGTTGNGYLVDTQAHGLANTPNILKLYCDKTSVELQFPDGRIYTVARFATNDQQQLSIYGQDPNNDNQMTLAQQDSISNQVGSSLNNQTDNSNNNGNVANQTPTASTTDDHVNQTYTYTVHYFDNATGDDAGSATFTSSSPLSDADVAKQVQAGTKDPVKNYKIDQTSDDGQVIDIIANVSVSQNTPQSTTYQYDVTYIDNQTGNQVGTTSFTSLSQLSNSDLGQKIQAGTQQHVTGYHMDTTSTNGDTVEIKMIANVGDVTKPKSYTYSVAYFDPTTGDQVGTAIFTSLTALNDADVAKQVQNGTKLPVLNYKVDEVKPNADDSAENITVIAYVKGASNSSNQSSTNNHGDQQVSQSGTNDHQDTNHDQSTSDTSDHATHQAGPTVTNTSSVDVKPTIQKPVDQTTSSNTSNVTNNVPDQQQPVVNQTPSQVIKPVMNDTPKNDVSNQQSSSSSQGTTVATKPVTNGVPNKSSSVAEQLPSQGTVTEPVTIDSNKQQGVANQGTNITTASNGSNQQQSVAKVDQPAAALSKDDQNVTKVTANDQKVTNNQAVLMKHDVDDDDNATLSVDRVDHQQLKVIKGATVVSNEQQSVNGASVSDDQQASISNQYIHGQLQQLGVIRHSMQTVGNQLPQTGMSRDAQLMLACGCGMLGMATVLLKLIKQDE